jgi:hypothetical protein
VRVNSVIGDPSLSLSYFSFSYLIFYSEIFSFHFEVSSLSLIFLLVRLMLHVLLCVTVCVLLCVWYCVYVTVCVLLCVCDCVCNSDTDIHSRYLSLQEQQIKLRVNEKIATLSH